MGACNANVKGAMWLSVNGVNGCLGKMNHVPIRVNWTLCLLCKRNRVAVRVKGVMWLSV